MKLFICKKTLIVLIAAILSAGILFGVCAGVVSANSHGGGRTIVIDAGHGGVDAGVRGINSKTKESEINLSISKYLRG